MPYHYRAARAVAAAALAGVVALSPAMPASADEANTVTRMAEHSNAAVNLVETKYTAKAEFRYTDYTPAGAKLQEKARQMYLHYELGSLSEAAEYIFERVRRNPTRYLRPMRGVKPVVGSFDQWYTGSSFNVSGNGYVMTARHVVTATSDVRASFDATATKWAAKADSKTWRYFLTKMRGWKLSNQAKRTISAAVTAYQEEAVKVHIGQPRVWVLLRAASPTGSVKAEPVPADVVYRSGGTSGVDVAVLQVHVQGQMSSLALASTPPQQGDPVYLNAFPALADRSLAATLTSSVMEGKVTAIKPNETGLLELQTNVGASWGASGGALMNQRGEIVGIVVSVALGPNGTLLGEDYSMPLETIREALARSGAVPELSQTTMLFDKALDDFHASHFVKALDEFKGVESLYPAHAYVDDFISRTQMEIAAGHDVPDVPPPPPFPWSTVMIVAAAVLAVGGSGVAVMLIRRKTTTPPGGDSAGAAVGEIVSGPEEVVASAPSNELVESSVIPFGALGSLSGSGDLSDGEGVAPTQLTDINDEDAVDEIPEEWEPIDYVDGFPDGQSGRAA